MLTTIHDAIMVESQRENDQGHKIVKPKCVNDYCHFMGGIDLGDQMMNYYSFLCRSIKWWRKLFIHVLNMLLLKA